MALEIERKWLMDKDKVLQRYPTARYFDHKYKEIYYLIASPELDVRISKTYRGDEENAVYKLVIKQGRGLAREEIKIKTNEDVFAQVAAWIRRPPVKKEMRKYSYGGRTIEENLVDNKWGYCEIEYPTVEAANEDDIVLGKEVTGDYEHSMSYYWNNGLPCSEEMTEKEIKELIAQMVKQDLYAKVSQVTSPEYAKIFFDLSDKACAEALREYGKVVN